MFHSNSEKSLAEDLDNAFSDSELSTEEVDVTDEEALASGTAYSLSVDYHTQAEIKKMAKILNCDRNFKDKYSTSTTTKPAKVGSSTLQNTLNTLNLIRYVAGISYDVKIGTEDQENAEVLASGYKRGSISNPYCSACILGSGCSNLYDTMIGWLQSGYGRRIQLDPLMQYVGFGVDGKYYSIAELSENRKKTSSYTGIVWPAQNMPLELVDNNFDVTMIYSDDVPLDWSISLCEDIDRATVSIDLVRKNDGKKWHFDSNSSKDDLFISKIWHSDNTIYFRPDIKECNAGDSYSVSVNAGGKQYSYDVNFFWMHDHTGGKATCTNKAVCSVCKHEYGELKAHQYSKNYTVDEEPTSSQEGTKSRHCTEPTCEARTDITVIPKLSKQVTVKFNSCSGKVSKTKISASYGKKYGTLPTASRKGYSFVGWFTAKSGGTKVTADSICKNKKTHTLYAHWKLKKYTITYNYNGGQTIGETDNPTIYSIKDTIVFAAPGKSGYKFAGWYQDKNFKTKIIKISKGSTGNKTLYAKWNPIKYYVRYYGNGATSGKNYVDKTAKVYGKNYKLKKNWFKKTGYTFKGWTLDPKAQSITVNYQNQDSYKNLAKKDNATVSLYAVWKLTNYKITYKGINAKTKEEVSGFTAGSNPANYTCKKSVTLENPGEIAGYKFNGWYSDSKLKKKITKISKDTRKKVTVYASYSPITYTIAFNGNGATEGSMASIVNCAYDETYTLPQNTYKSNTPFMGWIAEINGNKMNFTDGQSVSNLTTTDGDTVVLSAQWFIKLQHHMTSSLKQGDYPALVNEKGQNIGCLSVTYAIGLSIIKGQSYNPVDFWDFNNKQTVYKTNTVNVKVGDYISFDAAKIYAALLDGRPTMVNYQYTTGGQHWVLVIGVKNNSLSYDSFICIDPAYGDERLLTECYKFSQTHCSMKMLG